MTRPSNNDWRIAGALGIDPSPTDSAIQETLTQGIGFPLRPVSGVPMTAAPELPNGVVAEGTPMQWMDDWQAGLYYPPGAYVLDGLWACIANTLTLDKPAPVPDPADPATSSLPDPWVGAVAQNDFSTVVSGQTYTFNKSGWARELKVYVPATSPDITYRIIVVDQTDPDNLVTVTIVNPVLVANAWATVSFLNRIILTGDVFSIYLEALNSSASTLISGSWKYDGTSQGGAPDPAGWAQNNQSNSIRIDKTDLDGADRSAELESVTLTSTISIVQTDTPANTADYRVNSVTDSGGYMTYAVELQSSTGGIAVNAPCALNISVPIPLATEYAEETAVWGALPSWASAVSGFLFYDGVDQAPPTTNAYGVDIVFEPAAVSKDWDIVAYSG